MEEFYRGFIDFEKQFSSLLSLDRQSFTITLSCQDKRLNLKKAISIESDLFILNIDKAQVPDVLKYLSDSAATFIGEYNWGNDSCIYGFDPEGNSICVLVRKP